MIREMAERIAHFAGDPSHVRCFAHIIALVAKSMLRQFDPPAKRKKKRGAPGDGEEEDDVDELLRELEAALEAEEATAREAEETEEQDDEEGWVNELAQMSEAERLLHEDDVRPVRLGLIKVSGATCSAALLTVRLQLRKLAHKVLNSTTIYLPRWRNLCTTHKIAQRIMPRDVRTRWNSSHDMLDFALEYRPVIDAITSERELGLRSFELSAEEWLLMEQLHSVLQVCTQKMLWLLLTSSVDTKACDELLLSWSHAKPRYGHPCHGPHRLCVFERDQQRGPAPCNPPCP